MIEIALWFVFGCVGIALLLNIVQLTRGPSSVDRILVLDTMVINSIALLIAYGILQATPIYFEAVLLLAMVGFVSTVAYCRFILHGDVIE